MPRVKHALVTGFPGFIGRRLVANLVGADPKAKVTALVEPRMADSAAAVAAGHGDGRVAVVPGDIGEPRLGLGDDDYAALAKSVDAVFHLAAIYNLAVPLELAQKVNVDGTGNVLDFCADAKSLSRLVYTSTAYVAGDRTGVVYEHELLLGQGFKNHYESTKFQAEVWVRDRMDEIPTTILRPAIVVGDSRSGETEKFDGPYYILRAISQAEKRGRPAMQFGRGDAPFNVVPVDFIAGAMAVAAGDDAMVGETLHLVDPAPLSSHDLMEALSQHYAGHGTRGRIPAGLVDRALRLSKVRAAFNETPRESIIYLNHPVRFDTRRAVALLKPHGLEPPAFSDYVEPMVAFFKAHEDDPALQPKG
jgi:thioester reductase-like protein